MEDTAIASQGVMSLDRYSYAKNSPVVFVDPSGNRTCSTKEAATGDETCEQNRIEDPEIIWVSPLGYLKVSDEYIGCGLTCGHVGTDYSVAPGSYLYASGDGTVVVADQCDLNICIYDGDLSNADLVKANKGYGNVVIIEYPYHSVPKALRDELGLKPGQSLYYVYGHLDSISVEPGQTVSPGQVIGRTGDTGNSAGAHLHLEVRSGAPGAIPPGGEMCGAISCYDPAFAEEFPDWRITGDPDARYSYMLPRKRIINHKVKIIRDLVLNDPAIIHPYYMFK